ncbi:MAG: biotin transporter BioY [Deltaproteobacteria bacterium]|nr:biotin transporter BioY [Deltaproteobacteria bacterium]
MPPTPKLRPVLVVGFAVACVGLSAQVDAPVPGSDTPQSLQTLAVAVIALLMSPGYAAATLLSYLAAGAVGFPVFADGASGYSHLIGPTAGYLFGFAVAAVVSSLWVRRFGKGALGFLGGAFGVHGVVLLLGWARLAWQLGAAPAFHAGVEPFLFGGVVKSLAAASLAYLVTRMLPARDPLRG